MSDDLVYICEICQSELTEQHHCKAICPNCGRMFDCSDLPLMRANGRVVDEHFIARPGASPLDLLPDITPDNPTETSSSKDDGKVADLP